MKLTIQQWTSPKSSDLLNTLKNFRRKWPLQYITFCPVLTQHLFQQSLVPCCALWKKNVHGHLKIFFRLNSDAFVQYNTLGALWNNAIQTLQLINTDVSPLLYSETSICYICKSTQIMYFLLHSYYQDHSLLFSCIEILHPAYRNYLQPE